MATLSRHLRDAGKKNLRRLFEAGQRLGVDILPRHFYSEVPDLRGLKARDNWREPRSMVGVRGVEVGPQLDFVAACCPPAMVDRLGVGDLFDLACKDHGSAGFGPVEGDFLHAFISTHRPARIVQVGCGVSTAVILRAADEAGYRPEVVCVEPFPSPFLDRADRDGLVELVPERAQDVPIELLTDLGEGGMLFVDSTHVVGPGSEVNRIIFEALPRLAFGTWAHFHDIYFPYDYQRGLMSTDLFFNNESALLHAFLIGNDRWTIRAALSMLHYADPAALAGFLPNYRPAADVDGLNASPGHFPASTYLQAI